jgi:hypothetical protein
VAAPERERVDVPPDAELAAPEADGADARPHGADAEDTDG